MRRLRIAAVLMALMLCVLVVGAPLASAAIGDVEVPVRGQVVDHPNASFSGKLVNPTVGYSATKDTLKVSGTLQGTLTKGDGTTKDVNQAFSTKAKAKTGSGDFSGVSAQAVSCSILQLDIGAIHLDLLGLVVDLAPIHLDVTAVPGAGNLLGNLLCAVAGLLDPNSALATFLNQLLAILFTL